MLCDSYIERRFFCQKVLATCLTAAVVLFGSWAPSPHKAHAQQAAQTGASSGNAVEQARAHFERGVQLVQADNRKAAIVEFEASYKLVPRPNTLYNLGLCHEALFNYDKAIEYYERYLTIASQDDSDRSSVIATLRRLRGLLGTLVVQSNKPAEVWLGDRKIGMSPGRFTVPAGRHDLELRRDGTLPLRRQAEVVAGQQTVLKLAFSETPKTDTERGISPVFFLIGASMTVITAGVGTYLGFRTLSLRDEASKIDPRLDASVEVDRMEQSALLADVFFISAGAMAIGTFVSLLFTDWEGEPAEPKPGASASVLPWLAPGTAGLNLKGAL